MGMTKQKMLELEDYLKSSDNFKEFLSNADIAIAEHLQEIDGGNEPLYNEVEDYARNVWDEYVSGQAGF